MFEPIIKTDISMLPKNIETNLDELEPFIWDKVESAKNLVVDATSIEDCEKAEADAALLTKMAKRISEFRLTWTKFWQSPFESVIAKCKSYERDLTAAGDDLRQKAKAGRDIVKQNKKADISAIWIGLIESAFGSSVSYEHLRRFFDMMCADSTKGCWLNRGKKIEAIRKEMTAEIERCVQMRDTAYALYPDPELRQTVDESLGRAFAIQDVVEAVNEYKAVRAKVLDHQQRRAEISPEPPKAEQDEIPVSTGDALKTRPEAGKTLVQDEPLETYTLRLTGTRRSMTALRAFLESHRIKFVKI